MIVESGVLCPLDAPATVPGVPGPPPGADEPLGPGFPQEPEDDPGPEPSTPPERRSGAPPESIFRAVNDTIYDAALGMAAGPASVGEFLCE